MICVKENCSYLFKLSLTFIVVVFIILTDYYFKLKCNIYLM